MLKTNYHKTILTLVWVLVAQAGLVAQTKDLPRLAQDDMRVCGNALNAVGRANPLVGSCKYVWARTDGDPFAQGEISDRNSHNPLISTNVTSSYGVTAYDITGAVMATDQITLDVISYSAVMHFPSVMAGNTTTPFSVSPTRGQTFENLDNDDNDNLFDSQDNDVSGTGDDELIRLEITAEFQNISITETNPLAAGSVRFWADPNRTTLVGINSDITMAPIANSVPLRYKIVLWVEGVSAHDSPDKYGFQIKNAAGADCGLPMTITVLGVSGIAFGGNNNGYVNTRNAEPTSNTLDCTNCIAGVTLNDYRVFADARSAAPTVAMDVVNISVSLSVAPIYPVTVYLRTFDVDDPSGDTGHVDPNDACPADINIACSGTYPGTTPTYNGQGIRFDANNDNRTHLPGQLKFGNLRDADANGIAAIIFPVLQAQTATQMTVSHHPGDNYRLAANADVDFVNRLLNRDAVHGQLIFNRDANLEMLEPAKNASHILTVWRVLNVEGESMPNGRRENLQNQYKGDIISFVSPTNSIRDVTGVTVTGDIRNTDIYRINLTTGSSTWPSITDLSADYRMGRFQNGLLNIGSNSSQIMGNSLNTFDFIGSSNLLGNGIPLVFSITGVPFGNGLVSNVSVTGTGYSFTVTNIVREPGRSYSDLLNCEVSINQGSNILMNSPSLVNGNSIIFSSNLLSIGFTAFDDDSAVLPHVLASSSIVDYFEGTYISPRVVQLGASAPFVEQFSYSYNGLSVESPSFWDSDALETNNYWFAYVVVGWQGITGLDAQITTTGARTFTDNDMDGEPSGQSFGITIGPTIDEFNCNVGKGFTIIYKETIRDTRQNSPGILHIDRTLENLIVHEIGHQFGLGHGVDINTNDPLFQAEQYEIGIMSDGSNDNLHTSNRRRFIPRHINQIRSRVASPGKGL